MINDEFQPGFKGLLGDGPGKHTANKLERMDHLLINNLENAIWQLWSLVQSQGHYGPFKMETTSGYVTETFDGDGTTTSFTLARSITKELLSGYDIRLDSPYYYGIEPTICSGYLSNIDTSTNLGDTIVFATAPSVGTDNVKVHYYYITEWSSALNSSAYLSDSTSS